MWFLGVFLFVVLAAWGAWMVLDLIGAALSQGVYVNTFRLIRRFFWLGVSFVSCWTIGAGLDWW